MINLIKNELIKIFSKKSLWILLIIMFIFMVLINVVFKYQFNQNEYSNSMARYDYTYQLNYAEEEIKKLDPNKESDIASYVDLKTQIDFSKLLLKYPADSWQVQVINTNGDMWSLMNQINNATYYTHDEITLNELKAQYQVLVKKLDSDDWRSFVEEKLIVTNNQIKEYEALKLTTTSKSELSNLEEQLFSSKLDAEMANLRLTKNINFGISYQNDNLNTYIDNTRSYHELDKKINKDYNDKLALNNYKSSIYKSKYALDHNLNLNKQDDARGMLLQIFNYFEIFVIAIIIVIAGSIVSDEFNKGTIKLLLIRPYQRFKLLLAKYLSSIIIAIIAVLAMILLEVIIGGIIFGFDSLKVPFVVFNFNTNKLLVMNIFAYLGIYSLAKMSLILLMMTLAFALSTIFTNSALAITGSIIIYFTAVIVNAIAMQFNIKILRYYITMNWNLENYLFGALSQFKYIDFTFSVIICAIYFIILMVATFLIFMRKDIRNI